MKPTLPSPVRTGEGTRGAALTVEVDPVELVRGRGRSPAIEEQYVSDRPYAASSLLSVAIGVPAMESEPVDPRL